MSTGSAIHFAINLARSQEKLPGFAAAVSGRRHGDDRFHLGRIQRAAKEIAQAFDEAASAAHDTRPFERSAINGYGLMQVVRSPARDLRCSTICSAPALPALLG